MNSNTKIAVSIVALIVIVIAGYYLMTSPKLVNTTGNTNGTTGSVNDTVKAFNSSADQENTIILSEEGESGVSAMTQSVNDAANAYDANNF